MIPSQNLLIVFIQENDSGEMEGKQKNTEQLLAEEHGVWTQRQSSRARQMGTEEYAQGAGVGRKQTTTKGHSKLSLSASGNPSVSSREPALEAAGIPLGCGKQHNFPPSPFATPGLCVPKGEGDSRGGGNTGTRDTPNTGTPLNNTTQSRGHPRGR